MPFSQVAFVNSKPPYPDLMGLMIRSLRAHSKHNLILQCIDFPSAPFQSDDRITVRHVGQKDAPSWFNCIFYWKPWIILDAISKGLQAGIYIEADHLLTPNCDKLWDQIPVNMPITPIHPDTPTISPQGMYLSIQPPLRIPIRRLKPTQPYVHAGPVLFRASHRQFLETWLENCRRTRDIWWDAQDESALNCTLWLQNARNHYLPIIGPNALHFRTQSEEERKKVYMYHGSKNVQETEDLLNEIMLTYGSCGSSPQSSQPQTCPCGPSSPPCEDASPCEPSRTSCERQCDPTCST